MASIATAVASGRSHVDSEFGAFSVYGSTGPIGLASKADYSGQAILVARVGANAGTLNVVDGEYGVTDNTIIIRIGDSAILSYVWRQLEAKHLNSMVFGSGQPLITGTQLKNLSIPFPPTRAEQEAIAEALSDADALIESLGSLLTKKRQIKQGAMQKLLTGKKRLPGFDEKWSITKLGTLLTICHGKSQRGVEQPNGPYPILATGGEIGRACQFLCDTPSVLIGRKGTIDRPRYMDTPFWSVDTLFYSIVHPPNCARFLYYSFCLIDWKQHNEASGVPSLNAKTVEDIEIRVPKAGEQTAIATVLSDMDSELSALESKLTKARQLKQGMMQELLTGRTRLV
jgi:type I restriction enzyme S subunit